MVQTNFSSLNNQVNHIVEIGGFVNSVRDHGGLIFIDLRSQSDLVQCVINPENNQEIFDLAQTIGSESVLKVSGKVASREPKLINPKIISGKIEIIVEKLEIVAKANVLPFEIDGQNVANEELRLKYRYLDLRRNKLKEMLTTKSKLFLAVRNWFDSQNFVEVQTPILANSSPEGARDFLIPSRLHPGHFYALPQAPQQFKQLLMVAGFNRYFQIAPCFRDEDPRADRHPGDFYQIDAEMAWSDQDDIYDFNWQFIQEVLTKFTTKKLDPEFTKIRYDDGMDWFGSDKPDLRIKNSNSQKTTPNQDIERFNFLLEKAKNDKIDQIVCSTIFTNGEDELFVAKRHLNSTLGAGKYEFVGGKMEKDETFWQTLERELKEETDLNLVEIVDYLPVDKDFSLNEKNYRVLYFYVRVSGQIKLNKEHLDYKFIASSEDLKAEENHEGEAKISQVLSLIKVLNDEKIEKNMMQDKNWIKQDWDISTLQIETERLILKPVSLDYAEDIFREFTPEVTQNLLTQPTGNFEDTRKFILKNQEKMQQKMGIQMVILNKNGEFLGITSLNNIGKPELLPSIWLKTTAQNQGFGNEAFTAMFEWAKKHFNFEYIAYGVFEGNERSFKIAKKLGGKFVLDFEMPIKDGRIVKVLEYHIPNPGYEKPIQTQDKNWIIDNLGWLDTKHIFRNSGFKAFADLCEPAFDKDHILKTNEYTISLLNEQNQDVIEKLANIHLKYLPNDVSDEAKEYTVKNFSNIVLKNNRLGQKAPALNLGIKNQLGEIICVVNIVLDKEIPSAFNNKGIPCPFIGFNNLEKNPFNFEKLVEFIRLTIEWSNWLNFPNFYFGGNIHNEASLDQIFQNLPFEFILEKKQFNHNEIHSEVEIAKIKNPNYQPSNSRVQALVVKNAVDKFTRSDLDKIQELGRSFGLPGLAYMQYEAGNGTISKTSPKPKILFATTNDHKIRLFDIAWKNSGLNEHFELITLNDLPKMDIGHVEENSGSFTGDALLKAQAYAKAYNLPTISQDRGFLFDALNWPGTDSKKVFTLDETHEFKKGKWDIVKDEYFERAKEILAKIDGLDRSMSVIQGLAICLPTGESLSDEFITKGQASMECKVSISGAGGMYDWFFVPNGLTHTITEFQTREEQDNFVAKEMYPITDGIVKFLKEKVKAEIDKKPLLPVKSPILKFLDEDKQLEIQNYLGAEAGDLVLFVAHSDKNLVHKAQNAIRKHIAQKLDLIDNNSLKFAWVYDFPFFEETDDGKIDFAHNPFGIFQNWEGLAHLETLQKARAENRLLELRAIQYDIACNGYEVLSGGRRNNIPECLMEGFKLVGYTEEEVKEKFGHMMEAYSYGAPTHAGFAWGIDRLFMVLVDEDNIRETIAFPKNGSGMDLMMNSPSTVRESQLKELSIKNI